MDFFEWNKVWGALLASILLIMVLREVGQFAYHEPSYIEGGYKIELPEAQVTENTDAVVEETLDLGALLVEASASAGERVAKRCLSCHNFEKGGDAQVGPNLWGVLGRPIGAMEGFRYSQTLQNLGGEWTYERMYAYLENPAQWAPGTNMAFAGLNRQNDRVNILAYMRQQADSAPPLPAAAME